MNNNNLYRPLELTKLYSNEIIKNIYSENYLIFTTRLLELGLPDDINKIVIERYNIIKHIMKYN